MQFDIKPYKITLYKNKKSVVGILTCQGKRERIVGCNGKTCYLFRDTWIPQGDYVVPTHIGDKHAVKSLFVRLLTKDMTVVDNIYMLNLFEALAADTLTGTPISWFPARDIMIYQDKKLILEDF